VEVRLELAQYAGLKPVANVTEHAPVEEQALQERCKCNSNIQPQVVITPRVKQSQEIKPLREMLEEPMPSSVIPAHPSEHFSELISLVSRVLLPPKTDCGRSLALHLLCL
jgi:hypothetical protein